VYVHDAEEGGEGAAHEHSAFMGDLTLRRSKRGARGGARSGPSRVGVLPKAVKVVAGLEAGRSCGEVCAKQLPGSACNMAYLAVINDCSSLKSNFDCAACADSVGPDQPNFVEASAPRDVSPGACLVNTDAKLFSCEGKFQWARRLCPCDLGPGAGDAAGEQQADKKADEEEEDAEEEFDWRSKH
jgi:hypothetical protein